MLMCLIHTSPVLIYIQYIIVIITIIYKNIVLIKLTAEIWECSHAKKKSDKETRVFR